MSPRRDPEQRRAYVRKYRAEHAEQIKAQARKYHAEYRAEHREQEKARGGKYRAEHVEQVKARLRKYKAEHIEQEKARARRRTWNLKLEVIGLGGGECACCGERRPAFLCVDHIDGGGRKDRERLPSPSAYYRDIKRRGFPKGRCRLLCCNCNSAISVYDICPHDKERQGEQKCSG